MLLIIISILFIAFISVVLAVKSVEHELSVPKEINGIKITKLKPVSGVIYSSNSS